ncbi:hypothetical protein K1X76_01890 [bacterium]|nr:hypothetical protein [bacterium]
MPGNPPPIGSVTSGGPVSDVGDPLTPTASPPDEGRPGLILPVEDEYVPPSYPEAFPSHLVVTSFGANGIAYSNLGDVYQMRVNEFGEKYYATIGTGIHSWQKLADFIGARVNDASSSGRVLNFEVDQYNFNTLGPNQSVLEQLQTLSATFSDVSFSVVIHGDPMEEPRVLLFNGGTVNDVVHGNVSGLVSGVWDTRKVQEGITALLESNPEFKALYTALVDISADSGDLSLGEFLEKVRVRFNTLSSVRIADNQRTQIFDKLDLLVSQMRQVALKASISAPVTAGFQYFDPVSTILRRYEPNNSASNHAFSIGGGAMVAQLHYARRLMDLGELPLDFRVTASSRRLAPVWEANNEGTLIGAFGATPLNQVGRGIYFVNDAQRNAYLAEHPAEVIYVNTKASELVSTLADPDFLRIIAPHTKALATPAKAYDLQGRIPYLVAHEYLVQAGYPDLARALVVEGGYFSAPDILAGKPVWMTFAGESAEALEAMKHVYTPAQVGDNGRALWTNGSLINDVEFVQSYEMAAYLMAGGANKNFLTYYLGSYFMDRVLDLSDADINQHTLAALNRELTQAILEMIAASEEIIVRILAEEGISVDHLRSPDGLRMDITMCSPEDFKGMLAIRARYRAILTQEFPARRVGALKQLIGDIVSGQIKNADGTVTPAQGTRNPRDGYIDKVIARAYVDFQVNDMDFESFRDTVYPEKWKGDRAQEGRQGAPRLDDFSGRAGLTLDPLFYLALAGYQGQDPVIPPEETRTVEAADGLDAVWGLPDEWVERFQGAVLEMKTNVELSRAGLSRGKTLPDNFFTHGFDKIVTLLAQINSDRGNYYEVTRRLMVLQFWLSRAQGYFERLQAEGGVLTPEQITTTMYNLEVTLSVASGMFKVSTTTELLSYLGKTIQDTFQIEAALNPKVLKKLGLNMPPDERPVSAEARVLAPAEVVELFRTITPDDDNDPDRDPPSGGRVSVAALAPAAPAAVIAYQTPSSGGNTSGGSGTTSSLVRVYEENQLHEFSNPYERYMSFRRALAVSGTAEENRLVDSLSLSVRFYMRSRTLGNAEIEVVLRSLEALVADKPDDLADLEQKMRGASLIALAQTVESLRVKRVQMDEARLAQEEAREIEQRDEETSERERELLREAR